MNKVFVYILLITLLIIAGCSGEIKVKEKHQYCNVDDDCEVIGTTCGCALSIVNEAYADNYARKLFFACALDRSFYNNLCAGPQGFPSCVNDICVFKDFRELVSNMGSDRLKVFGPFEVFAGHGSNILHIGINDAENRKTSGYPKKVNFKLEIESEQLRIHPTPFVYEDSEGISVPLGVGLFVPEYFEVGSSLNFKLKLYRNDQLYDEESVTVTVDRKSKW